MNIQSKNPMKRILENKGKNHNGNHMPKICLGENGFIFGQPWHQRFEKKQILEFARDQEFKGIELHPYFEPYKRTRGRRIQKEYEDYDLEIPCIQTGRATHLYSPISPNKQTRSKFVRLMKEWIEFAHTVGARVSTLTPPNCYSGDIPELGYSHEKIVGLFTDTCGQVIDTAEKNDIVLALEPEPQMILNGGFYRTAIDDVWQVLNEIESKHLTVLCDTTHAYTLSKGDPDGFLRALRGKVGWTHIADNDGTHTPYSLSSRHLTFGEGRINIEQLLKTFKETCPHLEWLQIDVWECTDPFGTARKNKEIVQEILSRISW
jgi:sugar phosphate isomerase/epimerase